MKYLFTYLLLLSLFVFGACKKSRDTVSKEITLTSLDTLILESTFDVYLIQGNENKIRLEGAKNILDKVNVDQSQATVKIKNTSKGIWLQPENNRIKVFVTSKQLRKIIANQTCHIRTTNAWEGKELGLVMASKYNEADLELKCETFYYWNNFPCGGKINLRGETQNLKIWNFALMAVDASQLKANYVLVHNAAKADCSVFCLQSLNYRITGSGNIYVSGNPTNIEKVEGSSTGQLIFK
jgi:hypothetical protein